MGDGGGLQRVGQYDCTKAMPRFKYKDSSGYEWFWCTLCGASVICPLCGNNCCNGDSGHLADGSPCGCTDAYAYYQNCRENGTAPSKDKFPDAEDPTEEDLLLDKIFGKATH